MECPECGMPLADDIDVCPLCGAAVKPQNTPGSVKNDAGSKSSGDIVIDVKVSPGESVVVDADTLYQAQRLTWPKKSKTAAGLLALFFGGIGIHYFYLGKPGMGILYIVFCWTYIPAIISFVQAIIMLCQKKENFEKKWHVRCD